MDIDLHRHPVTDDLDRKISSTVAKLPMVIIKSATVVIEAALFLISDGLFNIPDVAIMNVQPCRAFLLNAVWLQEHMNI